MGFFMHLLQKYIQRFSVDLCCTKGAHKRMYCSEILWLLLLIYNVFLSSSLSCKEFLGLAWLLHCSVRVTFKPCHECTAAEWQTASNFLYGILARNSLRASGFSLFRERKHSVIRDWASFSTICKWSPFSEGQGSASLQAAKLSFSECGSFWCVSVFLELYVWI